MAENKVLRNNEKKTEHGGIAKEFNDIISFDTLGAILGFFFPICSVAFLLIKQHATNFWLGVTLLALGTFFAMWLVFFIFAFINRRRKAKELLQAQKDNLVVQLNYCRDCSLGKIDNGLEYRKLYTSKDMLLIEKNLTDDPNPEQAIALVYTSDMATLLRRKEAMAKNIMEKDAKYRIVYFNNTLTDDLSIYLQLEKEKKANIEYLDARECHTLFNSLDGQLMSKTDFEIIIFIDSTRKYVQGFFSVDNVSENALLVGRDTHDSECNNRCNYGKKNQAPIYKALDDEKARMLFNDIENLMKGDNLHE